MTRLIATIAGAVLPLLAGSPATAHNTFTSMWAPAGYLHDLEMRVTHGCKNSPVKEVRIKIPEGVTRVSVGHNRDWKIETRMRKLPQPVPGEGGNLITETVDEIIWKDPVSPIPASGIFEGFKFRAMLPNKPGEILFFRAINVCLVGDDKYVDLPAEPLKVGAPDFAEKLGKFMVATPGPSPFVILEKPPRPQYPFKLPPQTATRAAAAR
ncbi:MAG: YcnI family protein [Steroidobacteraceae bacterium]|nr:YcnI family protein [Steroidobacteraceae bacterium]MDW8259154.1 DUF1775 domain-containing protein [Gammaproteobacteria bacterium]